MNVARDFVVYALGIGAIELFPDGRELKSGRLSPYFFDSGRFSTIDALHRLAQAYVDVFEVSIVNEEDLPDVIFGPAYKGIPIATMVAYNLSVGHEGYNPGITFNRKEAKDHGEGGTLIGAPLGGKRVLIVDDVITDGASKREAVEIIREHGGTPIGCVIAFDRRERGPDENDPRSGIQRFQDDFDIPVFAAASLDVLREVLRRSSVSVDKQMLEKIEDYQAEYGV